MGSGLVSILLCPFPLYLPAPMPRYTFTWDVDIVLSFLETQPDNEALSFHFLTNKVLSNADRCFDLAALDQVVPVYNSRADKVEEG